LETDPEFLFREKEREAARMHKTLDQLKAEYPRNYVIHDPAYNNMQSTASTYVSNIESIIVGGVQMRFWMFRKHFNSMSANELSNNKSFFCWECITLQFGLKNVDLVIKNEY
jgi:hypothetical protein